VISPTAAAATLNGYGKAEPAVRPLHICMVHFSDFHVDSRLQRETRALVDRGHEVDSLCLSESLVLEEGRGVIRLHNVPARRMHTGGALAYFKGYGSFFVRAMAALNRLDRQRCFDVVEIHNMPDFLSFAALPSKLRGVPVILNVHDTFPELFSTKFGARAGRVFSPLMLAEERVSASWVDAVVTVTEEAGRRLEARGVGRGKRHVVMNSPDQTVFGPPREPITIPPEGPVNVVYHGGTAPRFGAESLVRAIGLLKDSMPELSLRVYGSFQEAPLGELAAEVAPDNVEVAPEPVPFRQIPEKLAECHIGVVPTLRDEFTELLLPVKLMEYAHMGLPAVASRLPVVEHYFTDDEVLFYEPGSDEALAAAIAEVRLDPERARDRASRASRKLEDLDWATQRKNYVGLVERLARLTPSQRRRLVAARATSV
jgi:glycosyltransferase involved in cell wall biosynthesis